MNFLVTTYIYPLKEPIRLSEHLKFCLDNPRTKDEILFVENHLIRAGESGEDYTLPLYSEEEIVTVEDTLFRFRDFLSDRDQHLKERFEDYQRETALNFTASLWVIARYDDAGETQSLNEFHQRMRAEGHLTFSLLDDESPILKNQQSLANYTYLLSLLVNSEGNEYHGRGFIIADPKPTTVQDKSMWFQLLMLGVICSSERKDDSLSWIFFPYAKEEIISKSSLLDVALRSGLADKFLYVGSLLRLASEETHDVRIRLLVLTSILELLVTHSPDYNRFNVEESIGKQFRLKVGLLTYLNNRSRNLDQIGSRLKIIYQQRSNIAHGNFDAINRYSKGLSKKEGEEQYFDDLITDLYLYIRAILEEYLKDRDLVEFLKTN